MHKSRNQGRLQGAGGVSTALEDSVAHSGEGRSEDNPGRKKNEKKRSLAVGRLSVWKEAGALYRCFLEHGRRPEVRNRSPG